MVGHKRGICTTTLPQGSRTVREEAAELRKLGSGSEIWKALGEECEWIWSKYVLWNSVDKIFLKIRLYKIKYVTVFSLLTPKTNLYSTNIMKYYSRFLKSRSALLNMVFSRHIRQLSAYNVSGPNWSFSQECDIHGISKFKIKKHKVFMLKFMLREYSYILG